MQTRQDITAARLLEMNPDMLVGSAARANALASGGEEEGAQQLAAAPPRIERPGAPAKARTLSLSGLPRDGAIVWGNPSGQTVTVFSDFRCGYCRALTGVVQEDRKGVVSGKGGLVRGSLGGGGIINKNKKDVYEINISRY